MLSSTYKPKPCEFCKALFTPQRMGQVVCSPICSLRRVKAMNVEAKAKIKTRREAVKTRGQLIAEAQTAFNAFIRARDEGLPCICCGQPFSPQTPGGSVDAGHYLSRGSAPHLRFDERNCFAQRKNCNRPGGTTRQAFRAGVVERIGLAAVEALEADTTVRKWTGDDLRAIRKTYQDKLKALRRERNEA